MSFSPEPPGVADPARIQHIHAYLALDAAGVEGIAAFQHGDVWYPMVCAAEARLKYYVPHVEKMRRDGVKVTLARFTVRTDLEEPA